MSQMRETILENLNHARSGAKTNYDSIVSDLGLAYFSENFSLSEASLEKFKKVKREAFLPCIGNSKSLSDTELLSIQKLSLESLQHANYLLNGLKLSVFENDPVSFNFLHHSKLKYL